MPKMKKARSMTRPKVDNTRKTLRKQKRQQKKVHRQEHYLKKKNDTEKPVYTAGRFVKRPADPEESAIEVKKKKPRLQNQPTAQDILSRQRAKEMKEANKLKSQMEEQRRQILLEANEDEDRLIKKLEKQLGLNKSKNKNNFFSNDGLDYLLEICDKKTTEQIVAAEKHLAEVEGDSDFEQDLAVVTGKKLPKNKSKDKKKSKKKADSEDSGDDNGNESELDDETGDLDDDTAGLSDQAEDFDDELSSDEDDDEFGINDDELSEGDDEIDDSDAPEEKPILSKKSKPKEQKTETDNKKKELKSKQDCKSKTAKGEKTIKETKSSKESKSKERIIKVEDLSKIFSDDEISHLSDDDDLEGVSGDEDENSKPVNVVDEKKEKPDVWEDIYGRKRDKEGNIIKEEKGVYVPPHLRNKDVSADDKQMQLLKRQIKSILNKLAGTNLHWACTSIENLYSNNSRNSVNTALTQLWVDATVGPSHTPDRMVTEHAALISVLHANVGSEIGAHFLQELCKMFDQMTQGEQPMADKRLDNLVSCLAHLYSFKIFHATLLYDLLNRLLTTITEKRIECVVTALRCVGGTMRKSEPAMLKDFVVETQARLARVNDQAHSGSRVKFLLEVLMAVKNNNLSKIPNYEPSYQEELRKLTRSVVRKGNYVTTLNIRLDDLLKADERGKWWVVGSAWEGSNVKPADEAVKLAPSRDQKLLELARKQRMNTDVRRSVFCVIMSAEDYMDAFEKLQHLGLKGQQEREIVHVLLACCLQENTFNPYYAVLGQKLCDFDRKYQLSIQYSIWDKIKDIENQPKLSLANLAQFLIHLIMQKGLPLSVLKVIQFSELNKHSVRFMRQILLAIIMNEDLQTSLEVFHRISKSPKLHLFRESLKLFIQHFLVKNAGKKSSVLSENEMEVLRERASEVNKILTMNDSKLRF